MKIEPDRFLEILRAIREQIAAQKKLEPAPTEVTVPSDPKPSTPINTSMNNQSSSTATS